ncbi:hypothetical protein EJB05_14072, partial [Eragrostis curvula]
MPPPPPLPELMDELVEEALLLIPPDEPAHLFRALLVYKRWCRLISSPRFRRKLPPLREGIVEVAHHRQPPDPVDSMLLCLLPLLRSLSQALLLCIGAFAGKLLGGSPTVIRLLWTIPSSKLKKILLISFPYGMFSANLLMFSQGL